MPARQLALDFELRAALGWVDFLVVPGNADAVAWLDRWPEWPNRALAIYGPAGCGKTHLAHVWQAVTGAVLIAAASLTLAEGAKNSVPGLIDAAQGPPAIAVEDADQGVDEVALFHLYNMIVEAGGTLLLTGRQAPSRWLIELPDLASRLSAAPSVALSMPDDELFAALLVKLFADRQLRVGADLVRYVASRIERSFDAARRVVDDLDAAALAGQRDITVPLARQVLAQREQFNFMDEQGP
jgi:DnaA regulatory inactivator Hda